MSDEQDVRSMAQVLHRIAVGSFVAVVFAFGAGVLFGAVFL